MAEAIAAVAQPLREAQVSEATKSPAEILVAQEQVLRAGARRYSFPTTFDLVANTLSKVVSCDCVLLLSGRETQRNLHVEAIAGRHQGALGIGMEVLLSDTVRELAQGKLRTAVCSDTRVSYGWLQRELAQAGILSFAAVALDAEGSSRNIIILGSTAIAQYGAADVACLQQLVEVISSSLRRCRDRGMRMAYRQRQGEDGSVREQQRLVSELSGGVVHSLSNVFGVVLGNLQLLEEKVQDAQIANRLREMQAKVTEGTAMLRSLSELSTSDAANSREIVDLGVLAGEIITLTRPAWERAGSKAIKVVHNKHEGVRAHVNRSELEEALINVIFNAMQALPNGGEIVVTEGGDQELAFVQVADQGVGMDEETRRRATEPFFTTRGNGRQGVGLSVASNIARKHGGYLGITSQPGEGSVVRIAVRMLEEVK